jgi:hypothetical protein
VNAREAIGGECEVAGNNHEHAAVDDGSVLLVKANDTQISR